MNKSAGLRTVVYRVPVLTEAKKWYEAVFEIAPYFDEPFYVGFNIGGYELGLLPNEDEEIVYGNSAVAYWAVEDIDKTIGQFVGTGAVLVSEPENVGEGIMVAQVKDPWGNIIGLIYNPYFKLPD